MTVLPPENLTIATTGLTSPTAGSDVIESLRVALATVMPPGRGLRIEGFTDLTANVTIALAIDPAFRRADVEAAVRFGWDSIIGHDGIFIGMKGFGESGPAPDLYKHFNITAEAVTEAVSSRLQR